LNNPAQHFRPAFASLPPSKTEKFSKHFFNRTSLSFLPACFLTSPKFFQKPTGYYL